ncbi:hypothetical protein D3C81_1622180 [compost metagenome]
MPFMREHALGLAGNDFPQGFVGKHCTHLIGPHCTGFAVGAVRGLGAVLGVTIGEVANAFAVGPDTVGEKALRCLVTAWR